MSICRCLGWLCVLLGSMVLYSTANAAVGRTPATFDVSARGEAQYTIPIWSPPGPNGLQPQIALSYSSANGNGVLGVGWRITGLTSIERCNRSLEADGQTDGVALTLSDAFCLNGNKLRLVSGVYGAADSAYRTETETLATITAYNSEGNGPQYFIVRGNDALTYEYGATADSRAFAGTSTTVFRWKLNKVSDRAGNAYVITYVNNDGFADPSTISWTPVAAGAATYVNTATFTYSTSRTDKDSTNGYVGGFPVSNRRRLESIQIVSGTQTVRNYVLGYDTGAATQRSRLTQVKECADSAAADCLAPTTIAYQPGVAGLSPNAMAGVSETYALEKAAYDFNGDGRHDLLYMSAGQWFVAFATTGGFGTPVGTGLTSNIVVERFGSNGRDGVLSAVDGLWYHYVWNDTAFLSASTGAPVAVGGTYTGGIDIGAATTRGVDVNGDGLIDLVWATASGQVFIRYNISLPGSSTPVFSATSELAATIDLSLANQSLHAIYTSLGLKRSQDFDGDGRQDIVLGTYSSEFSHSGIPMFMVYILYSRGGTFEVVRSQLLDSVISTLRYVSFNDDACADQIIGKTIFISKCSNVEAATLAAPANYVGVLDWDSDGRADFLVDNGGYIGVIRSTGTGLAELEHTSIPYTPGSYFAIDQDGDGLNDLVHQDATAPYAVQFFTKTGSGGVAASATGIPDLAISFTDGFGANVSPNYTTTALSNYTPGTGTTRPLADIPTALLVVNQVTRTDGIGGSFNRTYAYKGARRNTTRDEFTGFEEQLDTDARTGLQERTTYEQLFPLAGLAKNRELLKADGTTIIQQRLSTWTSLEYATGTTSRHYPYISAEVDTRWDLNSGTLLSTSTTTNTVDAVSGAVQDSTTTVTEADSASGVAPGATHTRSVHHTLFNDEPNQCVGRIATTQEVRGHSLAGGANVTRSSSTTWDGASCRPTQQVQESGNTLLQVTQDLAYDSFGNVNSRTVTGIGMTPRTTTVTWDAAGQFPVSTTYPDGNVTQTAYDTLGLRTSETDPNGLVTSWTYDTFGRKLNETRPDGMSTAWTYNACVDVGSCQNGDPVSLSTGINQMVVIETLKDSGGTALQDTATYLDQFDRIIVTQSKTFGGYRRVGVQYDALGQVYRQSVPCEVGNCAAYWTTNTYDALGRMTASSRPISASNGELQTTTVAYQGLTTVTTDPQGKTTTKIATVTGALARSQDHDGYYQNFGYDAFGSLVSVTDSLSNPLFSASYAYGIQAFQVSANDIDRGVTGATFNALGEVTAITDARGSTFSMTYDALSRPLTRAVAGSSTTTWTWGASATSFNVGKLQSLSSTDGTTENYAYDDRGRLAQRQIISDATYDYNYSYSATTGLLDTLTYPTSTAGYRLQLQYVYQNGQLQQIKDYNAGTVFWQADAMNARGQITQETLGNGVVTNRAYDAVTGWLNSSQSGVGGGTSLQNTAYLFDPSGNLTQRQDNAQGLTENFYYDNLYRLDYTQLNGVTHLDLSYDALGNIVSKSDVGAYTYDATKPHRLTQISGGTPLTYDENGNATSALGATITWNSDNYPTAITLDGSTYSQFWYDANHNRWKQESGRAGVSDTTLYIGGLMEKQLTNGLTVYRHYIDTGSSKVVYVRRDSGENETYYTAKDPLGSMDVVSDASGQLVVRGSFQAFGARRTPTDWSDTAPSDAEYDLYRRTDPRGFTGHEHLDNLNLIHMNGRVYAPQLGKFLSPDPYTTDPENTQSYNRYSYVYNNPLSYIDPSGFSCAQLVTQIDTHTGNVIDTPNQMCTHPDLPQVVPIVPDFGGASSGGGANSGNTGDSTVGGMGGASLRSMGWRAEFFGYNSIGRVIAKPFDFFAPFGTWVYDGAQVNPLSGLELSPRAQQDAVVLSIVTGPMGLVRSVGARGVVGALQGLGNIGSHGVVDAGIALGAGQKWLAAGYREIAPGVFRSADGLRQFRMTNADLLATHGNIGSHVHFEALDNLGNVIENLHLSVTP